MAQMSIAECEELAAAFGPDLALWPDDARASAEALLAGPDGDAARAALVAARALDEALADIAALEAARPLPDALAARILADAASVAAMRAPTGFARAVRASGSATTSPRRFWLADLADTFGGWRTAAISAAACALIGLGAGYATPDAAVAALGYDAAAAEEEMVADLGWDSGSELEEFGMFGEAG